MTRLQANLLLTAIAVVWASAFVAQNLGMKAIGPVAFTGIRFLLGALVVLPLAIWGLATMLAGRQNSVAVNFLLSIVIVAPIGLYLYRIA